MERALDLLVLLSCCLWIAFAVFPPRAWRVREVLVPAEPDPNPEDLSEISVLIPARNEAEMLRVSLPLLASQGKGLALILVDDGSSDGTSCVAEAVFPGNLTLVCGAPPPQGWTGKLWALEQGLGHVNTPLILLLDADIALAPGILARARAVMKEEALHFLSLMAELRMEAFWERALMPAFIHFFKLLYPFSLSNRPKSSVAAAAGGFILTETSLLRKIGGFAAIRGAIIDDCALARKVKTKGFRTWIGMTRGVRSLRPYGRLSEIWDMVARTAFSQLKHSVWLLLLCTALLLLLYWVPPAGLLLGSSRMRGAAGLSLLVMALTYLPTLRFYGLPWTRALTLPLVVSLYLLMTWTSALRTWSGQGPSWKGRRYPHADAGTPFPPVKSP